MANNVINKNHWTHFTQIPNDFIYYEGLAPESKMLLIYLLSFDYGNTGMAFPSVTRIKKELNVGNTKYNKMMNELKDKGFLTVQQSQTERGFGHNIYIFEDVLEVIERNRNLGDEEPVPLKPACVDQASNNTNNIIIQNNIYKENDEKNSKTGIPKKTVPLQELLENEIYSYTDNKDLQDALLDYIDVRKEMKKPINTLGGLRKKLSKLNNISNGTDEDKIDIVDRATNNEWLDFYKPDEKSNSKPTTKGTFHTNGEQDLKFNTSNRRK